MVVQTSLPLPPRLDIRLATARRSFESLLERHVAVRLIGPAGRAARSHLATGGKRLRPLLALLVAEELDVPAAASRPLALAVELLHNAFLIRDDIEDGDRLRRGKPALWVAIGVEPAMNVADLLLSEAFRLIASTPAAPDRVLLLSRLYAESLQETVLGQAADLEHRGCTNLDLDAWFPLAEQKTGAYLAFSLVGPAVLAGWPEGELEPLGRAGRALGVSFQIRDDLIDLTAGKGREAPGADLREGKPSILVAHALEGTALVVRERERLRGILATRRDETSPEDVAWAIDLLHRSGSVSYAKEQARQRTAEALHLLRHAPRLSPATVSWIRELAERLNLRTS